MDAQGNDTYIGSRYTMGTSAHSAIGSFVDWKGHDIYEATYGSAIGIAWDHSHAYFLDYKGNDTYHASNGSFTMAQAAHHSAALFHDKSGKDTYHIPPGRTNDNSKSTDTSNMSIFLDEGGDPDIYSHSFDNNDIIKVSNSFIFIDLIYDISDLIIIRIDTKERLLSTLFRINTICFIRTSYGVNIKSPSTRKQTLHRQ